jgi:hypothetical protein
MKPPRPVALHVKKKSPRRVGIKAVTDLITITDPTTFREYDAAFVEKDANIVLRSSDGICYRIPSFTLRTTSGFFRSMMTLPQPDGASTGQDDSPITLDENRGGLGGY